MSIWNPFSDYSKKDYWRVVLKMILGGLFIFGAVSKMLSFDNFVIYIYSFNVFPYAWCEVLSRLLLTLEWGVGLGMILPFWNRFWIRSSIVLLLLFSLFLGYTIFVGNTDNCHCFGDVFPFTPKQSLLKNFLWLLVTLPLLKLPDHRNPQLRYGMIGGGILLLVIFIVLPTNSMLSVFRTSDSFQEALFEEYVAEMETDSLEIRQGNKILCFYSPFCGYCGTMANLMSAVQARHGLDKSRMIHVFWGAEESVQRFFERHDMQDYPYIFMPPIIFLDMTDGQMPYLVLVQDGKIVRKMDLLSFQEETIVQHLKKKESH